MYKGDPYKYDDVNVIKNKLNIKDSDRLERLERDITVRRIADIDNAINGEFNYQRLLDTHRYIFERIYDWAGKERIVQMTKGEPVLGGDTVRYSYPNNIEKEAAQAIENLNNVKWDEMNTKEKALEFSKRISEIWQVHPFREGNTRTIITFGIQFANENGFPMNKTILQEHSSYVRNALVKASDGQYSEYQYLANVFEDAMSQRKPKKKIKTQSIEKEYEYDR